VRLVLLQQLLQLWVQGVHRSKTRYFSFLPPRSGCFAIKNARQPVGMAAAVM
jgi:hypothetical protein